MLSLIHIYGEKRSTFSGKLGFVLSAAGASVGLGNIWRFPYLAAKYGGGIFLLVYIILALTFGYTMIVAETTIGRMTKKSPVGAYQSFGKAGWMKFGGWINAVIPILIVPYYSVIGGSVSYTHLNSAIRFGRTIRPLNISAIFHTRSTFNVEPMITKITTITAYTFTALLPKRWRTLTSPK